MSPIRFASVAAATAFALATVACSGDRMMEPSRGGPGMMGSGAGTGTLMSVAPAGNSAGVTVSSSITMRFSHAMASGMEQFVDLHLGDLAGPVVPMTCGWSSDRTVLTCSPNAPLLPQTRYTIHMGGGMVDANGHLVDMTQYGMEMGGQWAYPSMMGSTHGGMSWNMMSNGWQNANGSHGMIFTFTTA